MVPGLLDRQYPITWFLRGASASVPRKCFRSELRHLSWCQSGCRLPVMRVLILGGTGFLGLPIVPRNSITWPKTRF
jgi:hypothetical protein